MKTNNNEEAKNQLLNLLVSILQDVNAESRGELSAATAPDTRATAPQQPSTTAQNNRYNTSADSTEAQTSPKRAPPTSKPLTFRHGNLGRPTTLNEVFHFNEESRAPGWMRDLNWKFFSEVWEDVPQEFKEHLHKRPLHKGLSPFEWITMISNEYHVIHVVRNLRLMLLRNKSPFQGERYSTIVLLNVPYEEKDLARYHGAIWMPTVFSWVTPQLFPIDVFKKMGWLKRAYHEGAYESFRVRPKLLLNTNIRPSFLSDTPMVDLSSEEEEEEGESTA
jgi:hypothetical protein